MNQIALSNQHFYCDFSNLRSVLIRPIGDAVGDAIAHCAHLRQLKNSFPNLRTGIFATQRNLPVIQAIGLADEILEDSPETYLLQRNRWDLIIDFNEHFNSELMLRDLYLNAPVIVIVKKNPAEFPQIDANILFCPPAFDCHIRNFLKQSIVGQYLKEDAYFYLPPDSIGVEKMAQHWQSKHLRVLISPIGSTHYLNIDELAVFINSLPMEITSRVDFLFANSGSLAEQYYIELQKLCAKVIIRLSNTMPLSDYLNLVASSDFIIAVDSGTVHIGTANSKPLIAFYAQFPMGLNMWMPAPINNTPTMMVISKTPASNRNYTTNFDLPPAINWTIQQLVQLIMDKQNKGLL